MNADLATFTAFRDDKNLSARSMNAINVQWRTSVYSHKHPSLSMEPQSCKEQKLPLTQNKEGQSMKA